MRCLDANLAQPSFISKPFPRSDKRRFSDDSDVAAVHLRTNLLGVTAVGEKGHTAVGRQYGPGAACEPAEIADIWQVRDQKRVQLALLHDVTQPAKPTFLIHEYKFISDEKSSE